MNQDPFRPVTRFSVFPPVIKNLLIINGLFFLAQLPDGSPLSLFLTKWFALWPINNPYDFIEYPNGSMRALGDFYPWQIVTSSFLHGGFFHLLFNMFALWMFGTRLEHAWGSKRFLTFYFVCVVGASLLQLAFSIGASYYTVGASGGVYGLLLAFGVMYPNEVIYLNFLIPLKAKWFVIGLIGISIFSELTGTSQDIAHFAHLGGMIFGFLLLQYWRGRLPIQPKSRMYF